MNASDTHVTFTPRINRLRNDQQRRFKINGTDPYAQNIGLFRRLGFGIWRLHKNEMIQFKLQ